MTTFKYLSYERHDAVARISLNRPKQRNALSRVLLEELDAAFEVAVKDAEIKVIVLAGSGDHFSSGHDLGSADEKADLELRPVLNGPEGEYERSHALYVEYSLKWRDLPKPTIAEVQGFCIFGGFLIATVMDFIVAADDALFLPSYVQLFTAPWVLGPRKTKEILFESRFIAADEALELGLANRVVARADLTLSVMEQAARIAQNDSLRLRVTKLSTNLAEDAMGYRTATQAGHGHYMLLQNIGSVRLGEGAQLDEVGIAMKKLREGQ